MFQTCSDHKWCSCSCPEWTVAGRKCATLWILSICECSVSHWNLLTTSPLAPGYNVDPVVQNLFHGDDGALLNIAVRWKGGSLHDDTDVGSLFHTHHKHAASFLTAPVKTVLYARMRSWMLHLA